MRWTPDQQTIIDSRQCNLLVSAAAGSGKTAVLVERIIQMISDTMHPIDIDQLLVVTFTKAAAAQMRDKIAAAIEKMLEKEPSNEHFVKQLNYIEKANILTIDSFCYQVVKEHFHILGIDPGIRVGEAGELGLLRSEVLEEVIEDFYATNPEFVKFSESYSADKNDALIESYILKVYDVSSSYPRPSEWIYKAKESLHVTSEEDFMNLIFVKQYFTEVKSTVKGIRDKIEKALLLVRGLDGPLYMEKALLSDIMMIDDLLAAKTYTHFHEASKSKFAGLGRGKKGEFDEEIAEEVKNIRDGYKKEISAILEAFVLPFVSVLAQFEKQEHVLGALLDVSEAFRNRFLEAKLKRGILEFSDIEHFALQVLCKEYTEDGEPIPSDIGKEMSDDFAEILIDEYQDSNFLQEAILKCVSKLHCGVYNIFMVGDVKQSIYSFRMARPDLFMEKYRTYGTEQGVDCRKLLLKNNFRSRSNVLQTINYMFYQIMGEDLGGIEYTEDEALVPGRDFLCGPDDSVELLLAESKDFEFLKASDEVMTAVKEETLDEKLEDIGKKELEASIVAKKILSMLGEDGSVPYQVVEKTINQQTGEEEEILRNVQLSDMVILFRAPSGYQHIFSEVLMSYGIPVKVQNENGYFDTTEISLVLSLLRVIDNPHNDLEVVAVLRSYFAGFSNEELALLAIEKRKFLKSEQQLCVYEVIKAISEHDEYKDEQLRDKCTSFVHFIDKLQEQKQYITVSNLVSNIYYDTGYYYYVEVLPEGKQRIRNLDLFYEECRRFDSNGVHNLFRFLHFIGKLQKKSIALGGDPAPESDENVVRIMSIHKSKGLEFPVVFVSGMAKNFNLMDTKSSIIIHSDYYVGAKYVDTDRRCGNDTFARKAFASLMVTESIAEELRILYVALTRAKEKLIMTGVVPDITVLVKKYENIAKMKEKQLRYAVVHTAKNYLDLVVMALVRNATFHDAMQLVEKRFDKKGEHILSGEYELDIPIKEPDIRLHVGVYNYFDVVVQHIQSGLEKQMDREQQLLAFSHAPIERKSIIKQRLLWQYKNMPYTLQKSKLSVTEIKRMYEIETESADELVELSVKEDYVAPLPRFVEGEKMMDAAQKGTWMHKVMELLPNAEVMTKEQVEHALSDMWSCGRLPEETKQFITVDAIYTFVTSNLGKRMHDAAKKGNLLKEKQFVVGVSARELIQKDLASEQYQQGSDNHTSIVVQGIIDAYFKEGEKLILVDYKTDRIKEGQEDVLVNRYETQMRYYKETLERLTGTLVAESYIYSFALGKEILVLQD